MGTAATTERWEILPAMALFRGVPLPGAYCSILLKSVEAYGAVREATRSWGPKSIALFTVRAGRIDAPGAAELFDVGTVAEVVTLKRRPCCHQWMAELRVSGRLRMCENLLKTPFRIARVERIDEPSEDPALLACLASDIHRSVQRIATLVPRCAHVERAVSRLIEITDAAEALGPAMEVLRDMPIEEQQRALELPLLSTRLDFVRTRLHERVARIDPRQARRSH
jgi:Lon protease-like protein